MKKKYEKNPKYYGRAEAKAMQYNNVVAGLDQVNRIQPTDLIGQDQTRSAINIKVLQKDSVDERPPLIMVSTFLQPRVSLLLKHSFFFASSYLKNIMRKG